MHKRTLIVSLLLLLLLSACTTRARTPVVQPAWGRAGRVGVTSRAQPVALSVAPDGQRVNLVYPARAEGFELDHVHLLALDARGAVLADRVLDPPIRHLQAVQVAGARLVWSAGPHDARRLWHAPLPDLDGPASLSPQPLSPEDASVAWFQALALPGGDVLVLWQDARRVIVARLAADGALAAPPREVLGGVVRVAARLDAEGRAHLVWSVREIVTQLDLYHARLDPVTLALSAPQLVGSEALPGQTSPGVVDGPVVGLSRTHAYVSWTRRDVSLGGVEPLYTRALPLSGAPSPGEPDVLQVAMRFPPPAEPDVGTFAHGALAPPQHPQNVLAHVRSAPATLSAAGDSTAMVLPVYYGTRTRQEYQPTLVYWRRDECLGYQALTWTNAPSTHPAIAQDATGHLYVAWIESSGEAFQYTIYLASTAPALHAAWQRLKLEDYATIAVDLASRVASGVVLFPLIATWFFFPFVWLFAMLARGVEHGLRGQRVLLLALWVYWASKYLMTRQILGYVPGLSALAPSLGALLIYALPLLTLAASVALRWGVVKLRGTRNFSVMRSYLAIVLVDCALSMSVYAIGYYE